MLSPFAWGESCQALFGIQNIDVNLTLRRPLSRLLSGDIYSQLFTGGQIPVGSKFNPVFTVQQQQDARLHITYLQPQANQVVPMRLNYPFYTLRRFVLDIGQQSAPAVGQTLSDKRQYNFNNITLHECPKRMYIYARSDIAQQPFENGKLALTDTQAPDAIRSADYFMNIDSISVNFDSQDGRLSTLDSYDLWRLSVNNGYKRSYVAWREKIGSVLCLEMGKDLALSPLIAPGVRGNFQLSFEVNLRDIRQVAKSTDATDSRDSGSIPFKLYLIVVPTGVMTIENQLISISVGSITEEQVLTAPWADAGMRAEYRGMYGGNFFKNIWSGIKKAAKFAKPILGPLAGLVADAMSSSADPRAQTAGRVLGAVTGAMSGKGGRRSGGAKQVRCNSLARRM
jgi:hypothetical protein